MRDFIEQLRAKPLHIRQRIALGATTAVTAVVAVGWSVAFVASGALALSTPTEEAVATEDRAGFADLLGAAGAAVGGEAVGAPTLVVTDVRTESTMEPAAIDERTVIPF